MRILHLLDHSVPLHSGYSFRSRYLLQMEQTLGFESAAVTSTRHNIVEEPTSETIDGITYHRTPVPTGCFDRMQLRIPFWRERILTQAMAERLESVAREWKPDVLHAHSPMFNGQAAAMVAKRLGLPFIYHIRAFWEDDAVDKMKISQDGLVYRAAKHQETVVARQADYVACICEGLRGDLIQRGIDPQKIILVKNGVQPDAFIPSLPNPELARRLGLEGKRVMGFIGSFFHYEGLPDLVQAVAEIRSRRDDFVLLLVGGGEDEAELHQQVKDLGLDDCVRFTGRVPHEEVAAHYSVIDFLVYPRRPKRLTHLVTPLKPLEAAAMERCMIGSDVGGIRELLDELGVGATFAAGDQKDLVRALTEMLDRDSASMQAEGRQGREAVLEVRSWERALQPLARLYESMKTQPETRIGV